MSSDIPQSSGIYRITCSSTGKFYIGSAKNLRNRKCTHFSDLRCNKHCNQKLQAAWNKHGEDTFTFEVIEIVLIPELLIAREQYYLDKFKPTFNIAAVAGSKLGMKHSPETRAKQRMARLGKPNPHPGNTRCNLGKPVSAATREKLSIANRGKVPAPHTLQKAHEASKGNKFRAKRYIITSPDGTEYTVHSMRVFCQKHGLNRSNLVAVARGKRKHSQGWTARYLEKDMG